MAVGSDHDYKNFPELTNSQIHDFGFMSPHKQIVEDFSAEVIKVTDGDTITLRTDFRDFDLPLRFLNIDAPEMNAGGETAREWLVGQIEGEVVEVKISMSNRVGKYGRLLGKVVSRGLDMGESMMRMGMVVPFGQKNEYLPDNTNKIFRLNQWF